MQNDRTNGSGNTTNFNISLFSSALHTPDRYSITEDFFLGQAQPGYENEVGVTVVISFIIFE